MTLTAQAMDLATLGCDTHVHVIGSPAHYPMVAQRHYTPGPASTDDLQQHLKRQALGRVVIVQPSVYGTHNQCLLDALANLPQARGIAVLDTNIQNSVLQQLDAQGVRGIRLNFESAANHSAEQLKNALLHWSPRLAPLGWHIQVYAPFEATVACADTVATLPVPVVLDHFALWPHNMRDTAAHQRLLTLLQAGHIYIKLSASYRLPAFTKPALQQLTHRLLQQRPDRLLWGSDWPHTNREPGIHAHAISRYRNIDPDLLYQERQDWLHTPELQQCVLIDNPTRLYRFGD